MRPTFFVLNALCAVGLVAVAPLASAQAPAATPFPSKPIVIIVPNPPGGGPDVLARSLGEKLATRLGQPVVVENRPGASGMIGAAAVARAAPDGYTLMLSPNTVFSAPHVLPKGAGSQIDVLKDLAPVIQPTKGVMVMVANPSLGVKNAKDLVALVKKEPGLAYASAGNGSPMHIAGELFKKSAGVDMLHAPYKGIAPAISDVLAGHVKVTYGALGALGQHIESGRLVALGTAEAQRSPLMPNLPTLAEQGIPNVAVNAWYGVFAPKDTPTAVIDKLNAEINAVLQQPDMIARLKTTWEVPVGGTPQDLARAAKLEYDTTGKVVKEFNITAD